MASPPGGPEGILLIDKPAGWTSHDVVAKARRLCGQRRIGHTGTLDPMATGLLVLCLGRATRLVEYMAGHDKVYEGKIALGATTDTDDAQGHVISRGKVPQLDDETLRGLERRFSGRLSQRPPAYSAIKVGGKRAYAVARSGGTIDLPERQVAVHHLELKLVAPDRLGVHVECGSGTYVRSLARDIGEALGCGGHLSALRRHRAGPFAVDQAVTLETLADIAAEGRLELVLLPPDEGMVDRPAAIVEASRARLLAHGMALEVTPGASAEGPLRVYDSDGAFTGVGQLAAGTLRAGKILAD